MVWFPCEDCGENLKKPKLANHFHMFSAHKLSGIDCGKMFDQQSVQSHTQCITEAEKYGPKGQENASQNGQTKPDKPKKNSDVDFNVGLSSHAPRFCSGNNIASASASPCAQLRAAYHNCFNRWYSEQFSKGQWDKEECVAQWDKYRACLAQHLEDKHLRSILLGAGTSVQPTDNEDFSSLDGDGDFRH